MDNVITLSFGRTDNDGGKSRIRARREVIGLAKQGGPIAEPDSLVMLHADTVEYPCDVQPVA